MVSVGVQPEPGSTEWKIFDDSATEDVERLEPLIDVFIADAKVQASIEMRDVIIAALKKEGAADAIPTEPH